MINQKLLNAKMSLKTAPRFNSNMLILITVMAFTTIHFWLHWDFTVDDAAISYAYARNFAQGFGLGALYPGAARVEGYSNLLWVVILGIGTWIGFDTIVLSKVLGLAFSLGCVILLYLILRDYLHHKWMAIGLVLLPASLTFTFWSVSGLENGLYAFLILSSVHFLIREQRNPSHLPIGSGVSLILVSITRPEGLLYALAGLAYKTIQLGIAWFRDNGVEKRVQIKNLLIWIAVFLVGYGIFKLWHTWYFAYPWPNPIYAKASWRSLNLDQVWLNPDGWTYVRGFFRTYGAVYLIPFMFLGGLIALRSELRVLVIFALGSLVLPLYAPDWMLNYRFLYPFIPFATGLIILAADQFWFWFMGQKGNPIVVRAVALVLGLVFAVVLARSTWANLRLSQRQLECGYQEPWVEARCIDERNYWTMAEVASMYAELGSYAQRVGLSDPLYLIPDIGATSFVHNYRILDLAGLADIHLARADATQIVKQYLLREQLPDIIFTHSIWTRRSDLTALSAIWENYIPIDIRQDRQERIHGTFIRKDLIVSPVELVDTQTTEMAPGLQVSDIQALTVVKPGINIPIEIYWHASSPQEQTWQQQVNLINQSGKIAHSVTEELGYGWYPTTEWHVGEIIRQHLVLPADLAPGEYTLTVRTSRQDWSFASTQTVQRTVLIDDTAAYEHALEMRDNAMILATRGDYIAALETLQGAIQIYPDADEINSLLPDYYLGASSQLLKISLEYFTQGDIQNLLLSIHEAADLRGRQKVTPQWRDFSELLQSEAEHANADRDWERAYLLYLAASLANPEASWSAKRLEEARRVYLLNHTEATNLQMVGGIGND